MVLCGNQPRLLWIVYPKSQDETNWLLYDGHVEIFQEHRNSEYWNTEIPLNTWNSARKPSTPWNTF